MSSQAVLASAALLAGAAAIIGGLLPIGPHKAPETVAVAQPSAPVSVPSAVPSPAVSDASSQAPAAAPTDPMQVLSSGLAAYQAALDEKGGVLVSVITADSQNIDLSLSPAGDYRALTGSANAPEWVLVDGHLFARLGDEERTAQQGGLAALGKPDAEWTDAAVGAETQFNLLAAGNMANAVAELGPAVQDASVAPGENGAKVVEGTIQAAALGTAASRYGLSESATGKVAFSIDQSGVLTGYIVTPAAGQPVSALVVQFSSVQVQAPDPMKVVTLEDLARTSPQPPATIAPSAVASVTPPSLTPATPAAVTP